MNNGEAVNVLSDGTAAQEPLDAPLDAGMAKIQRLLEQRDFDPWEVGRHITLQMAIMVVEILELRNQPPMPWQLRMLSQQIWALGQLQDSLTDTQRFITREVLNFDGPKFTHVMARVIQFFRKAMEEAGLSEELRNRVVRSCRDTFAVEEPALRREVARIGS